MENFKNPPITEASLDIRVALPKEVTVDTLSQFHLGIKNEFPEKKERVAWEHAFQASGETQAISTSKAIDGYIFNSSTHDKVVQARRDGFTFNKLRPYSNWKEFSKEAQMLWDKYQALTKPANISRIGLRYLNTILIPFPFEELKDYCTLLPEIPPSLPQGLSEFFMRFTMPFPQSPYILGIVTLHFQQPSGEATAFTLILDVDVFETFDHMSPDASLLWERFEVLRKFKNTIFKSSITQKTERLFA